MNRHELIKFEEKIAKRFDDGELPYSVHFAGGNEDQLIEIFQDIKPGDYVFSTHRSHYHYLLHGGSPERLEQLILDGKSMFVFDRALNFYSSSIVCATPTIAAGVAWALKRKGSDKKVWCFIGDGAEDEGHFTEAARYVDGWNLPCTFVLEDNDRSVAATKKERWGEYEPVRFKCLDGYYYTPTYPHGGSGSGAWIEFKNKPIITADLQGAKHDFINAPYSNIKYKQAVKNSMDMLGEKEETIFVGYNVRHSFADQTLADIPENQLLETPLAENLMAGLTIGMSLEGFRPVLYFERHDFIFNALDALVNQVSKMETISQGQFKIPVIIRAVVGGIYPFYAGATHTSDYVDIFRDLFTFPVLKPLTGYQVLDAYQYAANCNGPVLISEQRGLY